MITPRMYTLAALGIILSFGIYSYVSLQKELKNTKQELKIATLKHEVLISDLRRKDTIIRAKQEEFDKWKALPREVRYETVVKYVERIKKVKECDEKVKLISSIDYNDL